MYIMGSGLEIKIQKTHCFAIEDYKKWLIKAILKFNKTGQSAFVKIYQKGVDRFCKKSIINSNKFWGMAVRIDDRKVFQVVFRRDLSLTRNFVFP